MKGYLIGVDIGTQGTKAVLFDTKMQQAATAFEPSKLVQPATDTVWQEAEDMLGSVARTIARLMEQSGASPASVLGIGVDSQMAGIMGIDQAGDAATYYDSWLDTRCKEYARLMAQKAGRRVTEITGGPVTYTHGPKILWWKHEQPDTYRRIRKFVLPHGYVVGKMCGLGAEQATFDYTCLQYSGFGDNRQKTWSDELLEQFQVGKDKMARIASPFEIAGTVAKGFAQTCGLAEGIPVAVGAGDTSASIFGAGMFEPGRLLDCAGTASVLCGVTDQYQPDTAHETLTMMRSPQDGIWFPLAYINGGGMCIRWFRDQFTGDPPLSYGELEKEAAKVSPGSEGVIFVPHFGGRVLPSQPNLRGSFSGLSWKHEKAHLFRAVLEGISYEYAYYLSVLKKLYPQNRFDEMAAIGGGANSPLFLSIKADVLGVNVTSYHTGDTALVGSAVIAGCAAGVFSDYREPIQNTIKPRKHIRPVEQNHAAYKGSAAHYLAVLNALSAV